MVDLQLSVNAYIIYDQLEWFAWLIKKSKQFNHSDFVKDFLKHCTKYTPDYQVIGGDLNLVMDVTVDKKGGTPT